MPETSPPTPPPRPPLERREATLPDGRAITYYCYPEPAPENPA